jgi:hypothetical protein
VSTLRRQSRYWTPLLLGWLRGGVGGGNDAAYYDNSLDLPLTSKQRRQQRQKDTLSSSSTSSSSSSQPEVQIEALRALAALTEWTSLGGCSLGTVTNIGRSVAQRADDDATTRRADIARGGECSPHSPMSASSQRLLLRHADAVPTMVSLLSSEDGAVREQAMWMLGSIASGGLGAASLPPAASSASVARTTTTATEGATTAAEGPSAPFDATSAGVGGIDTYDDTPSSSRGNGKDKSSLSARDVIFAAGGVAPLLRCLTKNAGDVPLHRVGAWCLSGLVEGRYSTSSSSSPGEKDLSSVTRRTSSAAEEIDVMTLLPTVRRMLHMDDAEVLTFACWTLSHFW